VGVAQPEEAQQPCYNLASTSIRGKQKGCSLSPIPPPPLFPVFTPSSPLPPLSLSTLLILAHFPSTSLGEGVTCLAVTAGATRKRLAASSSAVAEPCVIAAWLARVLRARLSALVLEQSGAERELTRRKAECACVSAVLQARRLVALQAHYHMCSRGGGRLPWALVITGDACC
jgi:hypothetical protein